MADTLASAEPLACNLRQMIAVLERERQALAALDADGLVGAARGASPFVPNPPTPMC